MSIPSAAAAFVSAVKSEDVPLCALKFEIVFFGLKHE